VQQERGSTFENEVQPFPLEAGNKLQGERAFLEVPKVSDLKELPLFAEEFRGEAFWQNHKIGD
jgi:hypothetical protein